MKKLRGTLNYKGKPSDYETPKGVSQTVPDDSYTIAELLKKHEQGLALGIQRMGNYDLAPDEDDFDGVDMNQFQQLEPFERQEIAETHKETVTKYKSEKARKDAEKAEKAKKDKPNPE